MSWGEGVGVQWCEEREKSSAMQEPAGIGEVKRGKGAALVCEH